MNSIENQSMFRNFRSDSDPTPIQDLSKEESITYNTLRRSKKFRSPNELMILLGMSRKEFDLMIKVNVLYKKSNTFQNYHLEKNEGD